MDDSIYDIMVKLKFQSASQWFGPGSEFGFENLLQIFRLLSFSKFGPDWVQDVLPMRPEWFR